MQVGHRRQQLLEQALCFALTERPDRRDCCCGSGVAAAAAAEVAAAAAGAMVEGCGCVAVEDAAQVMLHILKHKEHTAGGVKQGSTCGSNTSRVMVNGLGLGFRVFHPTQTQETHCRACRFNVCQHHIIKGSELSGLGSLTASCLAAVVHCLVQQGVCVVHQSTAWATN